MRLEQKAAIIICVQTGQVGFLWGPPGQGKSSFIRCGLALLDYYVKTIRANTILPHHLSGSPVPSPDGLWIDYRPPKWAMELNKAKKAALFIDDLSCATAMGQTACMGLLDEGEVGDLKLNCARLAAANPNSLTTARFDMDAAVANRCVHIPITSHGPTFRDDAMADFPAPNVPKLRSNWEQRIPQKRDLITAFLASSEGEPVINLQPEQINMKTVAWPSERSWKAAWQLLAACDCIDPLSMDGADLRSVRTLLFKGAVGEGAYTKFQNYLLKDVQPKVDDALRHGKAFSFPESGDELFGLLEAVSGKLSGGTLTDLKWTQAWSLLEGAWATSHQDRAVTFALDLISMSTARFTPPAFYEKKVKRVVECNN